MAEQQDDSIFSGIFKALRKTRKDDKEGDKSILTNAPLSNPFASKQQKQQDFLDFQSKRISEDLYSRSMYYEADRFTAYQDYRAMDNSPEVSAALDILADECVTKNEKGEILGIYSDNSRVKNTLKDLFYNVLNVNYNLGFWTRELLKFGDTFLKLEVDQNSGIYDVIMLPVGEIHRIENKSEELGTSKFKWDTNNLYFEEWQVAHFRLLSDANRLPYGRA
ncbi:MAG TPA: portal protein, partial [Nitrosopumilaceae archaeon]|nr:portal protein [Nitrosopumilaceae archaeon]